MSIPQWRVSGPKLILLHPTLDHLGEEWVQHTEAEEMRYRLNVVEWLSDRTQSLRGIWEPMSPHVVFFLGKNKRHVMRGHKAILR